MMFMGNSPIKTHCGCKKHLDVLPGPNSVLGIIFELCPYQSQS